MNRKRLSIVTAMLCIAVILTANIGEIKTYAEESIASTSVVPQETKKETTETASTQNTEEPSVTITKDTNSTQAVTTTAQGTDKTITETVTTTTETSAETGTETTSTETISTETTTEKSDRKNTYTLQYKAAEGGTVSSSEETVSSQDGIKGSTAAPDNDHTFDGWYKDDKLITKDLTLIPTIDFTAQTEDISSMTETVSTTTETQETADTSVTQVYTAKFTKIASVVLEKEIDGRKITVKGIHIPEEAELLVVSVSNKDAEKTVNELNDDKATFTADVSYDISILVDGKIWQPADHDTTVTVSITNIDKDKITENDKELKVYRISDDKKEITDIDATVKEDVANFDTDHFTIYTVGGVEYDIGENSVILVSGSTFNDTIDADVTSLTISDDGDATGTLVSETNSPQKAYVTYSDNIATIHTSKGSKIYLNPDCNSMFAYSKYTSIDLSLFDGSKMEKCANMFGSCSNLISVNFHGFNSSNLKSMSNMFGDCTSLVSIDLSELDTSNVTDMRYMFSHCTSLTHVIMNGMNTSNVVDMHCMFAGCRALVTADLDEIDVSSLQNASYMFADDYMLQNIDLSKWNTKNLQNTYWMFYHESNWTDYSNPELTHLTSIDLHNWNTSNLTNAEGMFGHCNGLVSVDVSGWNTNSLQNCSNMFYGCVCLTDVNIKDWNTTNIDNMYGMFSCCLSLENIDISNFNTRKAAANSKCNLFDSCEYLDTITLSNDCIDIGLPDHQESYNLYPHYSSNHNTTLYNTYTGDWVSGSHASHFDSGEKVLSKADNLAGTWYAERFPNIVILESCDFNRLLSGCANGPNNIKNIIVKDDIKEEDIIEQSWNANTVLDNGIFTGTQIAYTDHRPCNGYGTVPATGTSVKPQNAYAIYNNGTITIHTPKDAEIFITDGGGDLFHDFSSLESVELDKFDVSHITGMYQTFANCSSLKSLDLSSWDISNVKHVCQTFFGCSSLESLDISNFDSSIMADNQEYEMFKGCNSLSQITLGPKFKFLGQDVYDKTGALVSSDTCFFTPTIPENTFTGNWVRTSYSTHTGQITSKDFKDTFNADPTTMAGTWYAEKNYLTITYDKNRADSGTVPAVSLPDVGAAMTVAGNTGNLTKTGYAFAGWNTKADGSGTDFAANASFTPTSNLTLYVKWIADTVPSSNSDITNIQTNSSQSTSKLEPSTVVSTVTPISEVKVQSKQRHSASTSDNSNIEFYIIVMILSFIGIVIIVKKRKKNP